MQKKAVVKGKGKEGSVAEGEKVEEEVDSKNIQKDCSAAEVEKEKEVNPKNVEAEGDKEEEANSKNLQKELMSEGEISKVSEGERAEENSKNLLEGSMVEGESSKNVLERSAETEGVLPEVGR